MPCKKGFIKRSSFRRKTGSRVKSKCIKATSQSGLKRSSIDKKIMSRLHKIHQLARQKFGTPKCKKGEIVREGSKRKRGSTKYWTKPTCIKDIGRAGKGKQLFVLEKDVLSKYGYQNIRQMKLSSRRRALSRAIKYIKPLSVLRRINALYVLNKNQNPKLAQTLRNDFKWLQNKYYEK